MPGLSGLSNQSCERSGSGFFEICFLAMIIPWGLVVPGAFSTKRVRIDEDDGGGNGHRRRGPGRLPGGGLLARARLSGADRAGRRRGRRALSAPAAVEGLSARRDERRATAAAAAELL